MITEEVIDKVLMELYEPVTDIEQMATLGLWAGKSFWATFDPVRFGDGHTAPTDRDQKLFECGYVRGMLDERGAWAPSSDGWLEGTPDKPGYYMVYGESLKEHGKMVVAEGNYDALMEMWTSWRVSCPTITHYKPQVLPPGHSGREGIDSMCQQARAWTEVYRFCFASGMARFVHFGNATQRVTAWINSHLAAGSKE